MKLPKAHNYKLELSDQRIDRWINLESNTIIRTLGKPLTSSIYKIYVLHSIKKQEILYIGTTKMSLKSRINGGLKANGNNGYHGYQWKNLNEINISIWVFPNLSKKHIENIEAELAFIVRLETGKWPKHQNEIHFNNSFGISGNKLAKEIYEVIAE